jgi:hypothetical protein
MADMTKPEMQLFGQSDPKGGDGYVPGAWDQVRAAYLDGHITEEAYEVLHRAMYGLRQAVEVQTPEPPVD